jgi:hypothetical protein
MSLWRDEKYLRLLSPTLSRFTQKTTHTYNFRCPLCGDSETNKAKARGYIFAKGDTLLYKCHNCSVSLPFSALLRSQSRHLYDEYLLERLKEDGQRQPDRPEAVFQTPTVAPARSPMSDSPVYPLSILDHAYPSLHVVYTFAKDIRKLPITVFDRLYATEKAHTWIRSVLLAAATTDEEKVEAEKKSEKVSDDLPYLVTPFRMLDGSWFGAQLRPVERKEFTTFRWAHDPLKVFGLDAWNPLKLTYIVEGPIDALFIPNALSPCGSDLLTGMRCLEDADILKSSSRRVYVWDNEPRNKEIVKHIRMAVKLKENVVIWPRRAPKDINDMVRAGIDVMDVLPKRTFFGLNAELELAAWIK